MERHEIEAELDEVERDLAYIARRAHIAASNLADVKDAHTAEGLFALRPADRHIVKIYIDKLHDIEREAEYTRTCVGNLIKIRREELEKEAKARSRRLAKVSASGEGGAE